MGISGGAHAARLLLGEGMPSVRNGRVLVYLVCAMRGGAGVAFSIWMAVVGSAAGCGARTGLGGILEDNSTDGGGGSGGCVDDTVESCGSDVGECAPGLSTCVSGVSGPCVGAIAPGQEACNGLDDDCDGKVDEDFGFGQACDGPDTDLCSDDVMTCLGCSLGPNNSEICNGQDDNCNGIVDSDCESGNCSPTLLVTGSTPSEPDCVDFPVEQGSTGVIQYPCGGGAVTAVLGSVALTGSVVNGFVSLDGNVTLGPSQTPDGCTWTTTHHIEGSISSGRLEYSYGEIYVSGFNCWSPCTETGVVEVQWN